MYSNGKPILVRIANPAQYQADGKATALAEINVPTVASSGGLPTLETQRAIWRLFVFGVIGKLTGRSVSINDETSMCYLPIFLPIRLIFNIFYRQFILNLFKHNPRKLTDFSQTVNDL